MLFLIVPLLGLDVFSTLLCLKPNDYLLCDKWLEVHSVFGKTQIIRYEAIFELSYTKKDAFLRITETNEARIYYSDGRADKMLIIRTDQINDFVSRLKNLCPVFQTKEMETAEIERLFSEKQ